MSSLSQQYLNQLPQPAPGLAREIVATTDKDSYVYLLAQAQSLANSRHNYPAAKAAIELALAHPMVDTKGRLFLAGKRRNRRLQRRTPQ